MPNDVQLILKQGTSAPTTVSLELASVGANLSMIDRPLKKAGRPELKPLFSADDETWLQPGDVLSAFESAREFFSDDEDDELDDILFEVVAEQLGPAIDVLRALPKDSVIRLEVIKSKPRKRTKRKPARTRSSGLAAARASGAVGPGVEKTSLKLTAKQREYVQSLLEDYRCDADLWAFPDIERKARASGIDRYSGLNHLDALRKNLHEQHQVTDDECEALVEMSLFSTDLIERGVARRIAFNVLGDLRIALSLEARIGWVDHRQYSSKGADYADAWTILKALAVRDVVVARRILDFSDGPLTESGHRATTLLYNAMFAVLKRDDALQRDLVAPIAKQKAPEAYRAILNVVGGVLTEDPPAVADGLTRVLATFRRIPLHDEEKLISFVAHGLAELALEKNAKLLDNFDVAQGMPWDAALFEWLRGESSSPVYPELAKKSPLLDKWLNRFEIPDSWGEDD